MKKIIAILMACLFVLSFTTAFAESEKTLSIVCTTFPQYDWVRQILGDHVNDVDLTLLLDNGVDLQTTSPLPMTSSRLPRATCSSTSAANPTAGWRMCWRRLRTPT